MSLVTQVTNLATRIATELKSVRTLLNGNASDNSALLTAHKATISGAINELYGLVQAAAASGGASIDDATTTTTTTWSSSKTATAISDSASSTISTILGGAGAAYDTLQELRELLTSSDTADDAAIEALTTAIGNRVRYDAAQALTAPQKAQALANIGAASAADVGDTTTNFVTTFESGLI